MTQWGGLLLAGGQSRRMGQDKVWLELGGEPLGARLFRVLTACVDEVVVVREPQRGFPVPGARLVADAHPGQGPLEAIASGLEALTAERVVVVACDMPFVTIEVLRRLMALAGDAGGGLVTGPHGPEPLLGIYPRTLLPELRARLAAGDRRPRALLPHPLLRTWPLARVDATGRALVNLNDPEALAAVVGSVVSPLAPGAGPDAIMGGSPPRAGAAMSTAMPPVPAIDVEDLVARFLRYVAIDTTAHAAVATSPSNPTQLELGRLLVEELRALGLEDAGLDAHGYVTATLPGTAPGPMIGFVAHLDTSADAPGGPVKPIIRRNYQGEVLTFPGNPDLTLSPANCRALTSAIGEDLITTDGTTLLGADDKAGVAAIMSMLRTLAAHPDFPHVPLRIAFTPDEEIGRGTRHFDVAGFGTRIAYTIDGETAPEFNDETFSAASALLTITGLSVHPGKAKDVMVNAVQVLHDFLALLPRDQTPETTEGREGYFHPHHVEGSVEQAKAHVLLRDFDLDGLQARQRRVEEAVATVRARHPGAKLELVIEQGYRNMGTYLAADPRVVALAREAMSEAGLEPVLCPVRGGTDGSNLSRDGILTPNLFTGSGNHHGLAEWASIQQLTKVTEVALRLARRWTREA